MVDDGPARRSKILLHVGCGPKNPNKLHPWFRGEEWLEVRLDIDRRTRPDVVADVARLDCIRPASVDAIWSSHNLEHLHEHECRKALQDFVRVLKPSGYALMTMPDIVRVAEVIARGGLEEPLYDSPAGTIYPLDTIFGLRSAVEGGFPHMAHKTAFSSERLGRMLIEAGFAEARVWEGPVYDVWGVGLMPQARMDEHEQPRLRLG